MKAFEWVEAARKKQPGLAYVRLSREELTLSALEDAAHSGGLFVKRLLVLLDDPYSDDPALVEEHIDALARSDNAIVVLAPRLSSAHAKKILSKAAKAYEFTAKEIEERRGFNFGLVNALATKSREKLWLEVVRALDAGDAPEMLHGLLHWKARDLIEKGSRIWSAADARALSLELIQVLQDARRTGATLEYALEKFALSV